MQTYTTCDRPKAEQYAYWREIVCSAFVALEPLPDHREHFESEIELRSFQDVNVATVRSRPQTMVRGQKEIRRDPAAHYFCNLQVSGRTRVRQHGREALIEPGDFFLVDNSSPYEVDFMGGGSDRFSIVNVRIPQHLLAPRLTMPNVATAIRFSTSDHGLGSVTGSYLRSLESCRDDIKNNSKQVLVNGLLDFLTVTINGVGSAVPSPPRALLVDAIQRYIDRHLADPELCVDGVARIFGVSGRYVHKLLEPTDRSFAQLVLEQRLDRCAQDLAASFRPISEVAYRWGFGDLSHFCRSFRRRHGVSAREWRKRAADRPTVSPPPAAATLPRLSPHTPTVSSAPETVGLVGGLDDVTVVREAIQQRHGHLRIDKDARPFSDVGSGVCDADGVSKSSTPLCRGRSSSFCFSTARNGRRSWGALHPQSRGGS